MHYLNGRNLVRSTVSWRLIATFHLGRVHRLSWFLVCVLKIVFLWSLADAVGNIAFSWFWPLRIIEASLEPYMWFEIQKLVKRLVRRVLRQDLIWIKMFFGWHWMTRNFMSEWASSRYIRTRVLTAIENFILFVVRLMHKGFKGFTDLILLRSLLHQLGVLTFWGLSKAVVIFKQLRNKMVEIVCLFNVLLLSMWPLDIICCFSCSSEDGWCLLHTILVFWFWLFYHLHRITFRHYLIWWLSQRLKLALSSVELIMGFIRRLKE